MDFTVPCFAVFYSHWLILLLGSLHGSVRSHEFNRRGHWRLSVMDGNLLGAVPAMLNVVMAYMVRSEGEALHASIGTMSGCLLNIILDPIFILPWGLNMGAAEQVAPPFYPTAWPVSISLC